MAAKKTSELIPMCHPLNITSVEIELTPQKTRPRGYRSLGSRQRQNRRRDGSHDGGVRGRLTIYDMCKAVDREMSIGEIRLVKKSGGKSGTFIRKE